MDEQGYARDKAHNAETHLSGTTDDLVNHEDSAPYDDPPVATLAAIEFQVASLLNDRFSTVNWPGREPLVVNQPGALIKKLQTLRRIAKAHFPSRGDLDDVLNRTIDEYGLWKWANSSGFWTAFKRDMFDARKVAYEAKRVTLEKVRRSPSDGVRRQSNSYVWQRSNEAMVTDEQITQKWLAERREQFCGDPVFSGWEYAKSSRHHKDRLIATAISQVLADEAYREKLATKCDAAKLTRIVAELRALAGCSQAKAYRLIRDFKTRHFARRKKR